MSDKNNNNNNSQANSELIKEGFDIWQEILSESIIKKDSEEPNIFIFGDKSTGKKSLIRLMNKEAASAEIESKKTLKIEEEGMKYGLMNYSHLIVKKNIEDDTDTVNKVGVWLMNELIDKDTFLTLIKPKDILKCVCLIVVDYSRPWTIIKSIKKWADFIYNISGELILKYPFDKQKEIKKKSK
jgi:hypothetical protein